MANYANPGNLSAAETTADYGALMLLLARIGLSADFLLFGARKFTNPQQIWDLSVGNGLPGWLVYPAMILQLAGGLFILLGLQTRIFAAFFAWFCIVAPSLFWFDNLENLTRDYAAAGGFLLLVLFGPGPLSLDGRFRNMRDVVAAALPFVVKSRSFIDRVSLIARALIALPFLADVVKKLVHMAAQRALFESKVIPGDAIYLVMLVELVFGLMLLLGYHTRLAATVLMLWAVILAGVIHYPGYDLAIFNGQFAEAMLKNFLNRNAASFFKDITTIASLLILMVYGPGAISRDARGAPDQSG
ncbi:MAG: DoxX family protein [Ramlibacter sp.]|nr:DoxX family protein [Ramlibacter sp.]